MLPVDSRLAARQVTPFPETAGFSPRLPSGRSSAIRSVCTLIRKVAAHDSSVLILGESGTGKEVIARAIHDGSPRRGSPFVAVNCGAIPGDLLESELFGHEKGAFTGAYTSRRGRFEIAEGGTLFLDEIGDMSLPMQVKLLRVLQERVFERVGNHELMTCDVRIIAATHRNLEESIARGQFRGDLFYRLNVVPIEVPSLRERIDDLEILIEEFAQQNVRAGRPKLKIAARAVAALKAYTWPGNVRELGNLIERLSVLNGAQTIDILDLPTRYRAGFLDDNAVSQLIADLAVAEPLNEEDLVIDESEDDSFDDPINEAIDAAAPAPDSPYVMSSGPDGVIALPEQGLDLKGYLYSIEQKLIQEALARSGGTVSQAARLLGLRRTTLVEKLRRFGMTDADLGD